jgi:hypothetical protein
VPTDADVVAVVDRQIDGLTRPGTWLTGPQWATVVEDARQRSAWVPIVGAASATTAVSAVAAELRDPRWPRASPPTSR